jgi:hypothetical protein
MENEKPAPNYKLIGLSVFVIIVTGLAIYYLASVQRQFFVPRGDETTSSGAVETGPAPGATGGNAAVQPIPAPDNPNDLIAPVPPMAPNEPGSGSEPVAPTDPSADLPDYLSPDQAERLESLGVNVSELPKEISGETEACLIDAVGEERAAEIKAGSEPNALELIRAARCF